MARIRTVKPELFRHPALCDAERASGLPLRLCFIGLFCVVDREGRFRWEPRELKLDVAPYDDFDFPLVLDTLAAHGFIAKYRGENGKFYGCIPSWHRHQYPNSREAESNLPPPPAGTCVSERPKKSRTRAHVHAHGELEGEKELEGKGKGTEYCTEPDSASADSYSLQAQGYAMPVPFITLPLNTGGAWPVYQEMIDDWQALYPNVDVPQALRSMRAWIDARPDRRKTDRGVKSFVVHWLKKDQDGPPRAGTRGTSANPAGLSAERAEIDAQIARLVGAQTQHAANDAATEPGHAQQ